MIEIFVPFLTRFKVFIRKGAISGPVVQPLTLSQEDKDKCISVLKRQIQKQKNKQSSPTKIVENPLNRKAWIKETFFSASFWACHYFIATVLTKISVRHTFSVICSYRTTVLDPLLQISVSFCRSYLISRGAGTSTILEGISLFGRHNMPALIGLALISDLVN